MDDANSIRIVQQLPNFANFFRLKNVIPLVIYFILFRMASSYVKMNFWLSFKDFKRYRLQNLSICWIHAVIVGVSDLLLVLTHPYEMFYNVLHYWNPILAQIPLISIAYFVHDALDMLSYEWSSWTFELLLHHMATCFALATPYYTDKLLLADGWALLMEFNSIFLHARTILQICGLSKRFPKYFNIIIWLNIITFVIFRIISQILWTFWALKNVFFYHWFYWIVGFCGPAVFGVINGLLFIRILASDGFISNSKFAMTRDKSDDSAEKIESPKNGNSKRRKEE